MKYLVLSAILITSLSACVTEYTCSCSGGGIEPFEIEINAPTQSDAEDQCAETEANAGTNITCVLL